MRGNVVIFESISVRSKIFMQDSGSMTDIITHFQPAYPVTRRNSPAIHHRWSMIDPMTADTRR